MNLDDHFEVLEVLFNSIPFVFWKDINGIYRGGNSQQAQFFGFSSVKDFSGKTIYEILNDFESAQLIEANDNKIMREGQTEIFEEEIVTPCGLRTFLSYKMPLLNKNNEVIGLLGTAMDITKLANERKERLRLELENQAHMIRAVEDEKFRDRIGHMVHDIRQPLATLQMIVNSTKEIPEEKRITLRKSTIAITDIASQFLKHYESYKKSSDGIYDQQIVLVSTALDDIIGEKRFKFKDSPIEIEYDINMLNAFVFIKANLGDFKRGILNLINNAIEALPETGGLIKVKLFANNEWVNISIIDNGKGISEELLDKIKNKQTVTYGKANGHGMGLAQVRAMVESNHGDFSIASSIEHICNGTTVFLKFPRFIDPDWIIEEIKLLKDDIIIILDDDKNIHGGWDSRLGFITEKIPTIKLKHFFQGKDMLDFIDSLSDEERNRVYLLSDFELIGQDLNGLDLIKHLKLKRSILVTSHYTNIELRKNALLNRVKILPKDLVHVVPIQVIQTHQIGEIVNVHMVFVDDEKEFTKTLISSYYNHLITDLYSNPLEFLDEVDKYPKNTKIILDNYYYLPDGGVYNIDGITIAEELHNKGYTDLTLLSAEKFTTPDYLKLVLKIDSDKLSKLDKI
ncbi:MAG: PAS domain-containing sensor histidine kinase [Neisseriaceae bacterium]